MKKPGLPRRRRELSRSALTAKRGRIRRNAARQAKNLERAYGGESRIAWVARQPSVVSGQGPCENVHVRIGGASFKADARWIVPMTAEEHRELHQWGKKTFERHYHIDLDALAAETDHRFTREHAA